jgi:hypothetical protein
VRALGVLIDDLTLPSSDPVAAPDTELVVEKLLEGKSVIVAWASPRGRLGWDLFGIDGERINGAGMVRFIEEERQRREAFQQGLIERLDAEGRME